MPLPTSGPISLSNVNTELGLSSTAPISLGSTVVRTLFGVSSGAISKSNGRGKSNRATVNFVFSANTQQATVNPSLLSGYVAGKSDITITVNSGVYVWSDSTSIPALIIAGGLVAGDTITLVNNGFIMGKGGDGSQTVNSPAAFPGGPAMSILTSLRITNNSFIGGGGGGGSFGGGGGAGGGRGGQVFNSGAPGGGGGPGSVGGNGSGSGGGGGRIMPGVGGGPAAGGGAGGGGGFAGGGTPASGGSAGNPGGNIGNPGGTSAGGGGGGWGAAGGRGGYFAFTNPAGGAGGRAINLNGNSITWLTNGTVYGAVA